LDVEGFDLDGLTGFDGDFYGGGGHIS
jgi:hypothetical protein